MYDLPIGSVSSDLDLDFKVIGN